MEVQQADFGVLKTMEAAIIVYMDPIPKKKFLLVL